MLHMMEHGGERTNCFLCANGRMYGGTVLGGQAAVLLTLPSCLLSVSRQFYPDSEV